MQRTLVLISILGLVAASLAIGALAAHWPFWSRAMAWHTSVDGWPRNLGGPWRELRAAPGVSPLAFQSDPSLAALAQATGGPNDLRYPFVTDENEQVLQTIGRLAALAENEVGGAKPAAGGGNRSRRRKPQSSTTSSSSGRPHNAASFSGRR